MERRAIADEIVSLFEALIRHNLGARLVKLIQYVDQPALQVKALNALINFASGPRIGSTPVQSRFSFLEFSCRIFF